MQKWGTYLSTEQRLNSFKKYNCITSNFEMAHIIKVKLENMKCSYTKPCANVSLVPKV